MRIPMKKNSNTTQKIQIDKVAKDANDAKGLKTNSDISVKKLNRRSTQFKMFTQNYNVRVHSLNCINSFI